jgi:hypothetical protein
VAVLVDGPASARTAWWSITGGSQHPVHRFLAVRRGQRGRFAEKSEENNCSIRQQVSGCPPPNSVDGGDLRIA